MIEVVSNSDEYFEFIRRLRNDERVKVGFIEQSYVTPEQQDAYMAVHADEYVIGLADGIPAGYAGSVDGDIRVCTHPDFQGKGIGRAMIEEILRRFPESTAKVKIENVASLRLFESVGFVPRLLIMIPTDREEGTDGT